MFYFVRHGQTDYSEKGTKIYQGFGVNLAPLSKIGVRQIQETAKDPRLQGADLILTSPYTRAVQTAAILSKELQVDIMIETDLHEWLADKNYNYEDNEAAEDSYEEYERCQGIYPGEERNWEDKEMVKQRIIRVLEKYKHLNKVIIAGHGLMIQATANLKEHPKNGEIVEFELRGEKK